jgi:hypothetical protein
VGRDSYLITTREFRIQDESIYGITNTAQFVDILSYRQRPTWRLAYRNWGSHETLMTNQSVEALPGIAGVRWYEIRRTGGSYSLFQQGTYAPGDGVHRWMGGIAQDKFGNAAVGYSVVNGTDVFLGIRYTGRLAGDPAGQITQGEGNVVNGSGVQTNTNSRWGDYTSLNIDPVDDCTFWYVNEYYTLAGQQTASNGWQTLSPASNCPAADAEHRAVGRPGSAHRVPPTRAQPMVNVAEYATFGSAPIGSGVSRYPNLIW